MQLTQKSITCVHTCLQLSRAPRLTSSLSSQKSDFAPASMKAQSCFNPSLHSFTSSLLPSASLSTSGSFANVRHRSESDWSNSAASVLVGACLREWRHWHRFSSVLALAFDHSFIIYFVCMSRVKIKADLLSLCFTPVLSPTILFCMWSCSIFV